MWNPMLLLLLQFKDKAIGLFRLLWNPMLVLLIMYHYLHALVSTKYIGTLWMTHIKPKVHGLTDHDPQIISVINEYVLKLKHILIKIYPSINITYLPYLTTYLPTYLHGLPSDLFLLGVSTKVLSDEFLISHVCYMPHPSCPPW
jgi:hypothetical protein